MCIGGSRLIKLKSTGKNLKELKVKMKTKVNLNKLQTFKIYNSVTKSPLINIYIYRLQKITDRLKRSKRLIEKIADT